MKQPREQSKYYGRFGDCERAVGGELMSLVEQAVEAGWNEREVVMAVADCALEYLQELTLQDENETVVLPDTHEAPIGGAV